MDPNATLELIEDNYKDYLYAMALNYDDVAADHRERLHEACQNLRHWIRREGFAPDWDKYPIGAEVYFKYANTWSKVPGNKIPNNN